MKNSIFSLRFLVLIILIYEFVDIATCENNNYESREDTGETELSMDINTDNDTTVKCSRRQNSQMHEITAASYKQFPFMVAIMSQQNEYLCSGSIVSNGIILTTAQCTQQPISYVLLNTTKDKKDDTAVVLHKIKVEQFPTYSAGENKKDIGLVYTDKHNSSIASKIRLSNFTSPRTIVDVEAIGFGLNAKVGQTRELQYVGMEHRIAEATENTLRAYFDCVDTKVLTCYKDTGGPIIFDNELIGIVVKGQEECAEEMTATYAVNKRLVDFVPTYGFKAWLDEKIKKNEEQEVVSLSIYPLKPSTRERQKVHKMTSSYGLKNIPEFIIVFMASFILIKN